MASKYDINTLMEHYPFSKFFNYIKSQQDLNNDSHLQGLPTYDVYGLTKNDVVDYLSKKTEILLDAKTFMQAMVNKYHREPQSCLEYVTFQQ